ncbi:helix-turn-helix domain-containing protein [Bifidobacterium longum]|uniref:helix-turn-helix transcriptional regulator n=1 Tax=Bifidobacterium longum TaxID=216816 RepID=UPI0023081C08|nr:helix-turn-helix domain-containing protein [Bifidobacterium longum]WCE38023.1 helix-turn-helix domain-containing protein [Bifidobacterium longum]
MSFRANLQYLRAQRNMTQEQLAMLLGVSRQAISKWESEKAYPEMDKLLMICDLFGCTLDDLVLGDVSASVNVGAAARGAAEGDHGSAARTVTGEGAGEPAYMKDADGNIGESARSGGNGIDGPSSANALPGETLRGTSSSRPGTLANVAALPQDLTGYDEHRCRFALLIAGGVAAIIAGAGIGNLFDSDNSILGVTPLNDFLTFLGICVGVIIGLAMLIPGGMSHTDFKRRHPYVEDFYTEEDRSRELRLLVIGIVGGIAAILIGIAVMVYADDVLGVSDGWPAAIMLLLCAPAVFGFIYCGMRYSLLNINDYNKAAETDRKEHAGEQDFYAKLTGAVCGIIMLIATVTGLCLLFLNPAALRGDWSAVGSSAADGAMFWLPWPIGGVLCGVAAVVIQLVKDYRERK